MSDAEISVDSKKKDEKVSAHDLQMKNTNLLTDYAHEMHQFIRQKAYETQVQFDKTLVYLCGGAIVLSYGLFATARSESLARLLFVAISSWGACCVLALINMVVLRWYFPKLSYGYYNLYDVMNEQVRVTRELAALEKMLQKEFSKINKTPGMALEILAEDRLTEKQCAELSQRYESVKIEHNRLLETTKSQLCDLNKLSKSSPASNFSKLLFFISGAICFFIFVYRSHIVNAGQLSCVPEAAPSNRPAMECKGSQAATNCVKAVHEKRETKKADPKQTGNER